MAWVNVYNCANVSGTTLTDLRGTNNGTLAGASLPTLKNGYLNFVGGNGGTDGDRQRVELNQANFNYATSGNLTLIIKYKAPNLNQAQSQRIIALGYLNAGTGYIAIYNYQATGDSRTITHLKSTENKNKQYNVVNSMGSSGRWVVVILCYSLNDLDNFFDGKFKEPSLNNTFATGYNLYQASSKATIGCGYVSGTTNYDWDLTGDVKFFGNRNDKMSIGQAKTYSAHLQGKLQ